MKLILFTFLVLFSITTSAEEIGSLYISKDVCPFEGCSYGDWRVHQLTSVYAEASKQSQVISKLPPETTVKTLTGDVHVIPGEAKMKGLPYDRTLGLDPAKLIYILDDVAEGQTRISQNGNFYITKIATSKKRCLGKPDGRRCWVDVLKEPVSMWWVKVHVAQLDGWVLVENNNLEAIDLLSLMS